MSWMFEGISTLTLFEQTGALFDIIGNTYEGSNEEVQCISNMAADNTESIHTGSLSLQGDSGGPLMCKEGGVNYITGVVSWGRFDCGGDRILPGVYADVHRYVDWINQHKVRKCHFHKGASSESYCVPLSKIYLSK